MKKLYYLFILITFITIIDVTTITTYATSESEIQTQVDEHGKEAVTGNVLIWFLCAIAFLKISQKIDSFMSSLGINVGHTGGSMLTEAMLATRGVSTANSFINGGNKSFRGGSSHASNSTPIMSGGLSGAVSRGFVKSAMQGATGQGGNPISKKMFQSSMENGGNFAKGVTSAIAKGDISSIGSMTGSMASQALTNYLGFNNQKDAPNFSDVEIGGGRITGTETSVENPNGISFGMYNADQYMIPEGDYKEVTASDNSKWYLQYAKDTVEKTPYMKPDGKIAYNENIVKKLPNMPKRKERT